jgi:hypothetical protein
MEAKPVRSIKSRSLSFLNTLYVPHYTIERVAYVFNLVSGALGVGFGLQEYWVYSAVA